MFTIAEHVQRRGEYQLTYWLVYDDQGEQRGDFLLFNSALKLAARLTSEAQEADRIAAQRRFEANQDEAVSYIAENYRRGQADAYRHVQLKLGFIIGGVGGTLGGGTPAFRRQLAELLTYLERASLNQREAADTLAAQRNERALAEFSALATFGSDR